MPRPPVIVFQAPNRIGLGHMSRLIAIATALRQLDESARIAFVIEGSSHSLLESHNLPYFTIPPPEDLCQVGSWASWPAPERRQIIVQQAASILRALDPDLVVFDCFPSLPCVAAAIDGNVPMALCLRKMRNVDQHLQRLGSALPLLNLLLVADDPEVVDVPAAFPGEVVFVGRIVRPSPLSLAAAPVHEDDSRRRVLVTGGGGGYAGTADFYNSVSRAFVHVRAKMPCVEGKLVTGPLFTEWSRLELAQGFHFVPFVPDLRSELAAADLVLCQAGYNTIEEVIAAGTPTICMPAPRTCDDQFERARRISRSHAHVHVFEESTDAELAALMTRCLTVPRAPQQSSADGAHKAAALIRRFVTAARSHAPTRNVGASETSAPVYS